MALNSSVPKPDTTQYNTAILLKLKLNTTEYNTAIL
jgi:hypothetical protein